MKRFLLIKDTNGHRTSHGTVLFLEQSGIYITEKPLVESMASSYHISPQGTLHEGRRVLSVSELVFLAPGIPMESIAPHVYQLELEGQL